jgi:hypothetical protein
MRANVTKVDLQELLKNVLCSVSKPVFDSLQIHREVILRDTPVIVENVLSVAPEFPNAVDVIFGAFVDEGFMMTDRMVFTESLEQPIPAEGIGVNDFDVQTQIDREPIGGLQLVKVKVLQNRNLPTQPGRALGLAVTATIEVTT